MNVVIFQRDERRGFQAASIHAASSANRNGGMGMIEKTGILPNEPIVDRSKKSCKWPAQNNLCVKRASGENGFVFETNPFARFPGNAPSRTISVHPALIRPNPTQSDPIRPYPTYSDLFRPYPAYSDQ